MPSTPAQLRAQAKWRNTHREEYNKKQLELTIEYYHNNKEKVLEYKKKKYAYDKQCRIFRNILMGDESE